MHYAVARIFNSRGFLAGFYTDFVGTWGPLRLLSRNTLARRSDAFVRMINRAPIGIPSHLITPLYGLGLAYAWKLRNARTREDRTRLYLWAGRELCRQVSKRGLRHATATYAFNSAAFELFVAARQAGLTTVLEQCIAPATIERELISDEQAYFPEWEPRLEVSGASSAFEARERAEWELADVILCGSEFVKRGIESCGGPGNRCFVVPYGFDLGSGTPRVRMPAKVLKVLTVGQVGLRKGSPHLLRAAELLGPHAEFTVVGPLAVADLALRQLRKRVNLVGPVPRAQLNTYFDAADVFLLPSNCEGSATVCYEALAFGLPVVTTPNAGSVVRDGIEGFIVRAASGEAIVAALQRFLDEPGLLTAMSQNAMGRSRDFTEQRYAERLLSALGLTRHPE